jgi:hypothetical protein
MLKCVYHPLHPFQVVEDEEADKLLATGVWFDTPTKAKDYLKKIENEINEEPPVDDIETEEPKFIKQARNKLKGKNNERK